MISEAQQRAIITSLNRIEGQLRGIRRMVQEPRLCIEILQQLSAAEAALGRVSVSILRYHVETCVPNGVMEGGSAQARNLNELVDIVDRFAR